MGGAMILSALRRMRAGTLSRDYLPVGLGAGSGRPPFSAGIVEGAAVAPEPVARGSAAFMGPLNNADICNPPNVPTQVLTKPDGRPLGAAVTHLHRRAPFLSHRLRGAA